MPQKEEKKEDLFAPERKKDHIDLAFRAQTTALHVDNRFYYEPLLGTHPEEGSFGHIPFLGKSLAAPVWVSSMTGGTAHARTINENLAKACKDFGLGMGLGSCRSLLESDEYLADFNVRPIMGDDVPLYANLGIAQLIELQDRNQIHKIKAMLDKLQADGLIIHVNPMQEWLQPEGDVIRRKPLEAIQDLIEIATFPIIVKEVGQGMGVESLRALLKLPIAAVEFAAFGGTNFAKLELMRADPARKAVFEQLAQVGHTAAEMVEMTNLLIKEEGTAIKCQQLIISGGIQTFLDGYYLIERSVLPSIYGQASGFLKHACNSYDELFQYVHSQIEGLKLAKAYLRVRQSKK